MSESLAKLGISFPDERHVPLRGLGLDENSLPLFAQNLYWSLTDTDRRLVRSAAKSVNPLVWGSGCSGTDSPSWSFNAISRALQTVGIALRTIHRYSAESNGAKRRFIMQCPWGPPCHLFKCAN